MISRRSAVLSPLLLALTNKSGSAKPVMGSGPYVFEVTHDWGELPADIKYGNTHGVCQDSQGHIYIHHTGDDSMVVFDDKGKFVKSWGKEFKGGAHGLHIRKEGSTEFLYLCDTKRGLLVKTTLNGEEVFTLGYPPNYTNEKYSPTNVAIAPNGDIYVGDGYGSSFINVYNKDGKYLFSFGGLGSDPGKVNCPHGLILDSRNPANPTLLVADRGNHRIQAFSLAGKSLSLIDGTNLPCYFDFNAAGEAVVPDLGARITLLDPTNKVILHLGDDSAAHNWESTRKLDRSAFTPGKFVCPHGACFDRDGNIFVVEWVEVGRVTKLRRV